MTFYRTLCDRFSLRLENLRIQEDCKVQRLLIQQILRLRITFYRLINNYSVVCIQSIRIKRGSPRYDICYSFFKKMLSSVHTMKLNCIKIISHSVIYYIFYTLILYHFVVSEKIMIGIAIHQREICNIEKEIKCEIFSNHYQAEEDRLGRKLDYGIAALDSLYLGESKKFILVIRNELSRC